MSLQRVKLLDDHIFVLRGMVDMLSEELCAAMEEREQLLDTLGIIDAMETDGENARLPCLESTTELGRSGSADVHGQKARSFSPTSPLDCCIPHEDVHSFDKSGTLSIGSGDQPRKQGKDRNDNAIYSEPLPTPRRLSSCKQMDTSEEVYINNALSDSDDDSSSSSTTEEEIHDRDDDCERVTSLFTKPEAGIESEAKASSPQCWIPNTAFASCVLHMIHPSNESKDKDTSVSKSSSQSLNRRVGGGSRIPSSSSSTEFAKSSESEISLRSCDSELIERASIAHRLSLELKRMRFELQEKEMQIDFLAEKLLSSKQEIKREATQRQRDTKALQEQLNEASASKFLLFCKLQTAEARLKESEERKAKEVLPLFVEQEEQAVISSPTGVLTDRKCNVLDSTTIDLSIDAQNSLHKRKNSSSPKALPNKVSESVGHHPLQETLSQAYKKLLLAEKRGDDLLQRVKELESQTRSGKKGTGNTSQSTNKTTTKPKRLGSRDTKKSKSESSFACERVPRANLDHCARPEARGQQDRVARRVKTTASKPAKSLSKSSRWKS